MQVHLLGNSTEMCKILGYVSSKVRIFSVKQNDCVKDKKKKKMFKACSRQSIL